MLEEVRGTIIGGEYRYYEFWQGALRVAKGWFDDDEQAEAWFKEYHLKHYEAGVEMRVWD